MNTLRLHKIEASLAEAVHQIDGVMNVNDPARIALDSLAAAVQEIYDQFREDRHTLDKVAGDLSCLQNGITPD